MLFCPPPFWWGWASTSMGVHMGTSSINSSYPPQAIAHAFLMCSSLAGLFSPVFEGSPPHSLCMLVSVRSGASWHAEPGGPDAPVPRFSLLLQVETERFREGGRRGNHLSPLNCAGVQVPSSFPLSLGGELTGRGDSPMGPTGDPASAEPCQPVCSSAGPRPCRPGCAFVLVTWLLAGNLQVRAWNWE